jgi:uncharacterized protein (DUF2252 family)
VVPVTSTERRELGKALASYGERLGSDSAVKLPLEVLDAARKLGSGGSSYGLDRFYALVAGAEGQPVVLEMKQCLPAHAPDGVPVLAGADPEGIARAQRELMGEMNPATGWTEWPGGKMLVRELEPEKSRVKLSGNASRKALTTLSEQAAEVLARAHARTPANAARLEDWVNGHHDEIVDGLWTFARAYADQAEADFAAFSGLR